jgi:hypothetical protein
VVILPFRINKVAMATGKTYGFGHGGIGLIVTKTNHFASICSFCRLFRSQIMVHDNHVFVFFL